MIPLIQNSLTGRISKRGLLARALDLTGCGRILRSTAAWEGVLILNYHRIGNRHDSLLDRELFSATDDSFDAQIRMLSQNFEVVSLEDFGTVLGKRHGRYVMVTFDDGYRDNYTDAYPILKKYGVPATFFITTGFLDTSSVPWWDEIAWIVRKSPNRSLAANRWTSTAVSLDGLDREPAIKRLLHVYKGLAGDLTEDYLKFLADSLQTGRCPKHVANELWMTWDMLREMRQNGMTFGGHTVNHPNLAKLSLAQQEAEIGPCKQRLVEELGEPIEAFSYPIGGAQRFNANTRALLAKYGFRWAFTYDSGYCHFEHTDRFAVPRTAIETEIDAPFFRAITTLPQFFT